MITSTSNPRVKEARKLSQRRQREQSGQLLVEGVRLINDAWQSGFAPRYLFYAPQVTADNAAATGLVAALTAAQIECLPCSPAVLQSLTETVTPQGVAAVLPLPNLPLPANPTLTLVLDQVREPGNAGALLRSAEAAGVEMVICTPGTVDPFNEKALRAGMGAHFRLPLRLGQSWAEVRQWLPPDALLFVAEADAPLAYDRVPWRHRAVLIIGGEASGASVELRHQATPIAIPMQGHAESLNAAVAGAVILFEAARQRREEQGERVNKCIDSRAR